ncbi:hypothetical protein CK203_022003 [Vitis vinifera]|uniref:Uncharacterized protein n=1 Tax=Vitis vinifera TaxID=29760 RepID=A0A438JFM4_VITVI|nr:hypothetical protein CK203_022003 [Vitis vinifera]
MGRVENLNDLVLELGCKVGVLSSSYLGLSLGAPFKFVAAWYEVERFCKSGKYGEEEGGGALVKWERGVSFWKDKWCCDNSLCASFPYLFALAVSKELYSCMFLAGCRVNANDDLLHSKEMLAMLYCMAIMR